MSKIDEPCPVCGHTRLDGNLPTVLHCSQCDHEWVKRSPEGVPKKCPVCRSVKWNEEKIPQLSCRICGHVWRTRSERPKRCPGCQSAKWDMKIYKLLCRRCGHKWVTKMDRSSGDVTSCPSCKSRKWNEVLRPILCKDCGKYYVNRSRNSKSRCPICNSKTKPFESTCEFCKITWNSTSDKHMVCPRCGKPRSNDKDRTLDIWSDGNFSLRYTYTDEFGFIYLWEGDMPVATIYQHDALRRLNINAEQFIAMLSDPACGHKWKEISDTMYEHRDDYEENTSYFMRRLNIGEFDAKVLAIHFTGMGPEAIAVRFGVLIDDVRRSFDRIMEAYTDSGIVVNDSIFTDDPLSLY